MRLIGTPAFRVWDRKGSRSRGSDSFIITVDTTKAGSANDTFVLPVGAGTFDYYADWGEGGAEEHVVTNTDQTHVYTASGSYQIKIRGTFPQIYFANSGDKLKLTSIDNWGAIEWGSFSWSFWGCENLVGTYTDTPDLSAVTNLSYMFNGCRVFNSPVNFNTENIIRMDHMFDGCGTFNQPVNFNTANVTFIAYMFSYCDAFNQPVNFNTEGCSSFIRMFNSCDIFNQDISGFDISGATNMSDMLSGANNFSTANYDALLISWAAQAANAGVSFDAGNARYTEGLVDSGTTDGTTADKLVDSTQNFLTTVTIGDVIYNTTDLTYARVTAIDDDTTLSLDTDIMITGEVYRIQHSDAAKARASLVLDDAWVVTDGGYL